MDATERRVIDDLFEKLDRAEATSEPRDPEAEALIGQRIRERPASAYYMAQAIVVMEQSLAEAQERIQALEEQARRPAGGLLGALLGGGNAAPPPKGGSEQPPGVRPALTAQELRDYRGRPGGGFLAGATQTAVGVAGGVLLGSAVAGMFAGDAAADAPPADMDPEAGGEFDDLDIGDDFF